jgi:hypothetical protein
MTQGKLSGGETIPVRDPWFIKAGVGIIALSFGPFATLLAIDFVSRTDLEIGPTFLLFLLGSAFGFLCVGLGFVGVLVGWTTERHK